MELYSSRSATTHASIAALASSACHAGVRKYADPGLANTGTQKPKRGSTLHIGGPGRKRYCRGLGSRGEGVEGPRRDLSGVVAEPMLHHHADLDGDVARIAKHVHGPQVTRIV